MISITTFSGQPFQTIHVTEDDTTYNDLLKYIKIPPHPRFEGYTRKIFTDGITVKPYIKLFHITDEVKLNDIIDFDSELTIGFYFEYYVYNYKLGDDFNLPDTSTHDKCKTLIEKCPFNIIFIPTEMLTDVLYRLAITQNYHMLKYVTNQTEEMCKLTVQHHGGALRHVDHQTEEICKLAVRQNGYSVRFVKDQTEEICKLAVQQDGLSLYWVKEQTEEICRLAVQQDRKSLNYVKDPSIKHKLSNP